MSVEYDDQELTLQLTSLGLSIRRKNTKHTCVQACCIANKLRQYYNDKIKWQSEFNTPKTVKV